MKLTILFAAGLLVMLTPAAAKKPPAPVGQPCRAAMAPVNYGALIRPDAATREAIATYRAAWQTFCKAKSGSINRLLAIADRIEKGVERAIGAAHRAKRLVGRNADRAHDDLQKRWPGFVPAFMGSIIEYEFFRPQMRVFHRHVRWGDARDRLFFAEEKRIFGTDFKAAPWIRRTWDYGGCTKFSGYDWLGNLARVAALQKKLGGRYAQMLEEYNSSLRRTVRNWAQAKEICTCGPAAGVAMALGQMQAAFKGRPGFAKSAGYAAVTLGKIRAGRTKVLSDKLQQCKYG